MADEKMEAEPVVIYEGKRSDASIHNDILDNPAATAVADKAALDQMLSIGLSREEAMALLSPSVNEVDFEMTRPDGGLGTDDR